MTFLWYLCFGSSVAVMLFFIWFATCYLKKHPKLLISPVNLMTAGVFLSATLLLIPIYQMEYATVVTLPGVIKTVLGAIYHAFSLFLVEGDFALISTITAMSNTVFADVYAVYAAILLVMAPILTVGVVLSFFKNIFAYLQYLFHYPKKVYVFSCFHEKSIALARSVLQKHPKSCIIFCNVHDEQRESELFFAAKELRAICFTKKITSVHFQFHSKKKTVCFFAIGEDENANVQDALQLIRKYQNRDHSRLYVFSNQAECEVLLNARVNDVMKVRRVSDVRTLVYSILETTGELLFHEAVAMPNVPDTRKISVLTVGMGDYGTEMVRSLAWFCQMDGYRLQIIAYDEDVSACEKFRAICPELMQDGYNHQFEDDGEAQYGIDIYGGIPLDSSLLYNQLDSIDQVTYVFVDRGSDEENIRTAINLRSFFLKHNKHPRIQTIVKNSDKKESLLGIQNYSGQAYDIDFVGDIRTFYTIGGIIESQLEQTALARHLKWGKEDAFWKFEYNYRSSMASALHRRMKQGCGVRGIDKSPDERSDEERLNLRKLEHRRWNAYMRSEGYTFAPTRNNLAKTHHCLVTYDLLTPEEKAKDDD